MSCNAKQEFAEHTEGSVVACAEIAVGYLCTDEERPAIRLPLGYTAEEYEAFLNKLNFKYDDGYGGQELYGTIWYKDGTWSERGEYDGSEWWEHRFVPEIPEELKQTLEMK